MVHCGFRGNRFCGLAHESQKACSVKRFLLCQIAVGLVLSAFCDEFRRQKYFSEKMEEIWIISLKDMSENRGICTKTLNVLHPTLQPS